MTVRTLSGATVTLVGRGANYFDGDTIIPSFVDADGTQYFIVNDPDDLTAVPAIVNGLLTVNAAAIPPITIAAANAVLVNDPTTVENSTSALVFAKRCGIDVSLGGLGLWDGDDALVCDAASPLCVNGLFCIYVEELLATAYVSDGWGISEAGYVGCNFEPISSSSGSNYQYQTAHTDDQWSNTLSLRRYAHNTWVFILAGVPESVFATE